ncbi:MAG: type IV pilus assembly protein PilM [Phycisphaerae bacterium]
MAKPTGVWGVDIGQCALKAMLLREGEEGLRVEAFDVIEHSEILSQAETDRDEIIRSSLEQFLERNDISNTEVAVAVPGQSSFTRFVKLPPVEPKKIPDIVRFEAEQQIPFPINDVIWRYQTFQMPDSPDVEVGIFAMKKVDVGQVLRHFREVELPVDVVQMSPLALYNFMVYDDQLADDGATLLVDVGADKTDLVVADGSRIWTRTIQIGGNSFTEALVRSFKLSFTKAEKLKRTAAGSKYARQIFQAMRPVFADLVQEIQRSVGYYTSLHRDTRFRKLVGLGAGFRLPGLQKFLEQNLGVPVSRVDSFNNLKTASDVNAAAFSEHILSFAVAYGLALQGAGAATVDTNLLPAEIARQRLWSRKQPWFAAAAAVIVAIMAIPAYRSYMDKQALADTSSDLREAERTLRELEQKQNRYRELQQQEQRALQRMRSFGELFAYREFWPSVEALVAGSIQAVARDQHLLNEYSNADSASARQEALQSIQRIPRSERQMLFIEQSGVRYYSDVGQQEADELVTGRSGGMARDGAEDFRPSQGGRAAAAGGDSERRGYWIVYSGRTPLSIDRANEMLARFTRETAQLADNLPAVEVVDASFDFAPMGTDITSGVEGLGASGYDSSRRGFDVRDRRVIEDWGGMRDTSAQDQTVQMPDPLLPDESMSQDTQFVVGLLVAVSGDGVDLDAPNQ